MNIEMRCLATMLKSGDFSPIAKSEVTKEHFETDAGKALFNFIRTYRGDSQGAANYPSLAIVRNRFDEAAIELPEPDGGDTVANMTHELKIQKFRSSLRQFALEADALANGAEDPTGKASPLIAQLRKATEEQQRVPHISLATGFHDVLQNYKHKTILPNGIPWPWASMTAATKGLQRGEFQIICGRPKSRKSFTAFRVAIHALKHHHCRVLIFTPEMPVKQVFLRSIAHLCDLHYTEFKDSKLALEEEQRMYAAAEIYGRADGLTDEAYEYQLLERIPGMGDKYPSLDIVQSTGQDVSWMAAQIQLYDPDLVVFDSFYRQRATGQKKNDTDWKAVSALSREMKDVCMEMNVAGLGTHQLNRGSEKTVGDLSNLALTDAIGADGDGIWRVVTGKQDGQQVSAIYGLGNRETDFEGVLIHNRPCWDYSEIGVITSRKQVLQLMQLEDEEEEKRARADAERSRGVSRPGAPVRHVAKLKGQAGNIRRPANVEQGRFVQEVLEAENKAAALVEELP